MDIDTDRMVVSLKGAGRREPVSATPMPSLKSTAREARPRSSKMVNILGLLLFLTVTVVGAYIFIDFSRVTGVVSATLGDAVKSDVKDGDDTVADIAAVEQEVADVIAAIGKHILLPVGEEPTVATVSDPDKLKDQLFFKHAEAGDKVLIYTKAKMAYLYDPDRDILLEVAPITTDVQ